MPLAPRNKAVLLPMERLKKLVTAVFTWAHDINCHDRRWRGALLRAFQFAQDLVTELKVAEWNLQAV